MQSPKKRAIQLLSCVPLALLLMTSAIKPANATSPLIREFEGYFLTSLRLLWDSARGDNLTVTDTSCIGNIIDANCLNYESGSYRTVRTEGCVVLVDGLPNRDIALRRLVRLHHPNRNDFVTVSTEQSIQEQLASGYVFESFEGYVFAEQQPGTIPLWLYWWGGRSDNATGATEDFIKDQENTPGMERVRIEGFVYPANRC